MPSSRVIVVGAGLAGLHAAWRLKLAGLDVLVLEARDRVGGRTWSHRLEDGTVVERGGEFIAPTDGALRDLCAELGLELVPHGFSFDRRPTPDRPAPTEDELAAFMAGARARVADGDIAASAVLTPPAERPAAEVSAARRLETSLTVPLARVSARRLFAGGDGHGYDPADRVRAGSQEAARELARRLGGNVRLRSPVTAIRHDSSAASVRCGGEELRAAAVIIAVPLPLLAALDLDPGLPPAIRSAAGRALFGDAAKLHVPLAHRPQAGRIASPSALWWCWTSRAPGERDAAPVLSAFAGGAEAVAGVGAAEGPDAWAAQALALRPDVEPAGSPFVTHWGADPWTRGSYISHGIGSTDADDAAWAEPWGRAVLAGEHTAGPAAGSMNGAVASGARAAKTVIELLRRRGA